ncbi:cytochrome c family protein [Sphingomonas sp. LY160]|jgi:cytochrome c|uniref:c-type cytochrome n=1 Tax=Sphingomonas sp. LY160 TaxID=3095342 RepID=UPI002ADEB1FD|nr:cytochrome c family protein [Sphingomonas sp. LY160]MEA1072107.1 cytochrome c family protein [Sphingomonas sp. LY160]
MDDRNNTIAGWVLFAGIVALGSSIVAGESFKGERPEEMGYPIEGVVEEGASGEAAKPIEFYLATADVAKGEQVFKKCTACHTVDQGGANGLGPNLWAAMGKPHGHVPGFAYSPALKAVPGTWDWTSMSEWLASPKKYAPGTKMTFAGLSNPEERANVIAFLNSKSPSPLPLPAAPPEGAPAGAADPAAGDKAAAEAEDAGAAKAPDQPVLNDMQAAKGGEKSTGGDAAPISQ